MCLFWMIVIFSGGDVEPSPLRPGTDFLLPLCAPHTHTLTHTHALQGSVGMVTLENQNVLFK